MTPDPRPAPTAGRLPTADCAAWSPRRCSTTPAPTPPARSPASSGAVGNALDLLTLRGQTAQTQTPPAATPPPTPPATR
jgi:hypothetical protein